MATARNRRRIFGCAALAMSLGLCLVVIETALRIFWEPPSARSDRAFGPHPVLGAAPLPGAKGRHVTWEYDHPFTHNLQGLRANREFAAARPSEFHRRVLFLGDSFTYGLGSADAETFVERLAAELPGVEFVNGGCNGYGQREELALLDTLGAALRPDLVVVVFFWNDLENNLAGPPSFAQDGAGRVVRTDLPAESLAAHDPLAIRGPVRMEKIRRPSCYLERLAAEGLKGLRYRLFGIRDRAIRNEEEKGAAWETTAELLRLLKLRADEIGSGLLVVSLPDHNRVDPAARIRGIEPLHFEIEEELAAVCAGHGIAFRDATGGMRAARADAPATPLYYYADRHLTPAGNAAFAATLLPWIREPLGE